MKITPLTFRVPSLVISMIAYPLCSRQEAFCNYPVLHTISPPWFFSFLLSNIFSISSQLRTCSWFVFLLTMVQKNRHSGVAGRIRSWILMLVVLICENFPVSVNFLLSSWTLVWPLNGWIWIFKKFLSKPSSLKLTAFIWKMYSQFTIGI